MVKDTNGGRSINMALLSKALSNVIPYSPTDSGGCHAGRQGANRDSVTCSRTLWEPGIDPVTF